MAEAPIHSGPDIFRIPFPQRSLPNSRPRKPSLVRVAPIFCQHSKAPFPPPVDIGAEISVPNQAQRLQSSQPWPVHALPRRPRKRRSPNEMVFSHRRASPIAEQVSEKNLAAERLSTRRASGYSPSFRCMWPNKSLASNRRPGLGAVVPRPADSASPGSAPRGP